MFPEEVQFAFAGIGVLGVAGIVFALRARKARAAGS